MPTPEGISAIAAAHRRFGTTGLLPTLISDTPDKMRAALAAAQSAVADNPSVLGIHFEGPFLSPEKPGVHDPSMFKKPAVSDVDLLTSWPAGVVVVTLAPECVPEGFIAALTRSGVRVSLGHSLATYAQTKAAIAEGLTGVTHIFNAMRPLSSREPGPIAAALETPGVWFGRISVVAPARASPAASKAPSATSAASKGRWRIKNEPTPPFGGLRSDGPGGEPNARALQTRPALRLAGVKGGRRRADS